MTHEARKSVPRFMVVAGAFSGAAFSGHHSCAFAVRRVSFGSMGTVATIF